MDGGFFHRGPLRSAEHRRASRVLAGEAGRGHGCPRVRAGAGRAVKRGPLDDREAQGTARQEGARRTAGGVLEVQEALHKQGLLLAPRQRRETPCRLRRQNKPARKTPAARSRRCGRAARSAPTAESSHARRQQQDRQVAVARKCAPTVEASLARSQRRRRDVAVARKRAPTGEAAVRNALSLAAAKQPRVQGAGGKIGTWRSRCAQRSCRSSVGPRRVVACDRNTASLTTHSGKPQSPRTHGHRDPPRHRPLRPRRTARRPHRRFPTAAPAGLSAPARRRGGAVRSIPMRGTRFPPHRARATPMPRASSSCGHCRQRHTASLRAAKTRARSACQGP